jgi:hypothetical protein
MHVADLNLPSFRNARPVSSSTIVRTCTPIRKSAPLPCRRKALLSFRSRQQAFRSTRLQVFPRISIDRRAYFQQHSPSFWVSVGSSRPVTSASSPRAYAYPTHSHQQRDFPGHSWAACVVTHLWSFEAPAGVSLLFNGRPR